MEKCNGQWKNDCPQSHCECAAIAMDNGANRDVVDALEESCPVLHPLLHIKTGDILSIEGQLFVFGKDVKTGKLTALEVYNI